MNIVDIYDCHIKLFNQKINNFRNLIINNDDYNEQIFDLLSNINEINDFLDNISNDNTYKLNKIQELYFNKEIIPKLVFMHTMLK